MPKILKAASVKIDNGNRVSIDVANGYTDEPVSNAVAEDSGASQDTNAPSAHNASVTSRATGEAEAIIANAKKEALAIINNARNEADVIVSEARRDSEQKLQEAYEESKNRGYNEGYQKGSDETAQMKADAKALYDEASKERTESIAAIEADVVKLVIKILEKIFGDTIKIKPELILCLVRQGIDNSTLRDNIIIHVAAEDYDEVVDNRDNILALIEDTVKLEIQKDPGLVKSDCIIETPFGNIDCSLDQQFKAIKDDLFYLLNESGDYVSKD